MNSRDTFDDGSTPRNLTAPRDPRVSRVALPPVAPVAPSVATQLTFGGERASFADAMRQLLERYAGEVRAFLRVRTNSRASMEEVFSVFSEDVWKGLPQYRSQGHPRAWIYVLARNALARHVRFKQRWRSRYVALELDELDLELEIRRSMSAPLGSIAQLEPLLAGLPEADRQLLEQRLVLSKPWRDIAIDRARARGITAHDEIARESARLRKRFQLILRSLRKKAFASRSQTT